MVEYDDSEKEEVQEEPMPKHRVRFSDMPQKLVEIAIRICNDLNEKQGAKLDKDLATEIQKKVNALSIEAAKQGLLPTSRSPGARGGAVGHRGGRGFYSPRGRGFYSPRGYHRGARGTRFISQAYIFHSIFFSFMKG